MADDRFDPEPPVDDDDPVALAEMNRWLDANHAWVKAKVQEALDDPRPALTEEELDASLEELFRELEAKEAT